MAACTDHDWALIAEQVRAALEAAEQIFASTREFTQPTEAGPSDD